MAILCIYIFNDTIICIYIYIFNSIHMILSNAYDMLMIISGWFHVVSIVRTENICASLCVVTGPGGAPLAWWNHLNTE